MGNLQEKVNLERDSRSELAEGRRFLAGLECKQSAKGSRLSLGSLQGA